MQDLGVRAWAKEGKSGGEKHAVAWSPRRGAGFLQGPVLRVSSGRRRMRQRAAFPSGDGPLPDTAFGPAAPQ